MRKLIYKKNNVEHDILNNADRYILYDCSGLSSVLADISASELSGHDGTVVTGKKLPAREVSLYFVIRKPVDDNRNTLLRIFQVKSEGELRVEQAGLSLKTSVTVKRVEVKDFGLKQKMQVTLYAADPYLYSATGEGFNSQTLAGNFEFPFSISSAGQTFGTLTNATAMTLENDGDAPVGIVCKIKAVGAVTNPYFWNTSTGEQLKLSVTMADGDEIIINTNSGKKSITKNGTNIIGKMTDSSKWVTLAVGTNLVGHSADTGSANMTVAYEYNKKYMAV